MCGDWIEWGEFFNAEVGKGKEDFWKWEAPEFLAYIAIAVSFVFA